MDARHTFRRHKENKIHWEQGAVFDLSWSSDGTLLTAVGSKGPVRSWRLGRGGHKEGEEHSGLGSGIERVAWCPEAHSTHLLAAAAYEKTVHLWDQRSGAVCATLATGQVNSDICWSASGKFLATASRDQGIEIFDVAQPQSAVVSADVNGTVNSIRWSVDDTMLLLSTHAGTVEVFAWPSMEHLTTVPAHAASCNCVGIDPRGQLIATGGADASMELWNADDFSLARTVDTYESPLLFADFSMDGRFVASASDDPEIRIHETFAGEPIHTLKLDSLVTALEWHPRNMAFAYGSSGSTKNSTRPSLSIYL